MPDQPTYTAKEFIEKLQAMDQEGFGMMQDLLKEEEKLYPIFDYGQIYKAMNLKSAMLDFDKINKK